MIYEKNKKEINFDACVELVNLINSKTSYNAKILGVMTKLIWAKGETILIKKNIFQRIKLVFDGGRLIYYCNKIDLKNKTKEIILDIEVATGKKIVINKKNEITFAGGI